MPIPICSRGKWFNTESHMLEGCICCKQTCTFGAQGSAWCSPWIAGAFWSSSDCTWPVHGIVIHNWAALLLLYLCCMIAVYLFTVSLWCTTACLAHPSEDLERLCRMGSHQCFKTDMVSLLSTGSGQYERQLSRRSSWTDFRAYRLFRTAGIATVHMCRA